MAILQLTNQIFEAFQNNNWCLSSSKTVFDTVNHTMFLEKLSQPLMLLPLLSTFGNESLVVGNDVSFLCVVKVYALGMNRIQFHMYRVYESVRDDTFLQRGSLLGRKQS